MPSSLIVAPTLNKMDGSLWSKRNANDCPELETFFLRCLRLRETSITIVSAVDKMMVSKLGRRQAGR